jgi:hypothetical protein
MKEPTKLDYLIALDNAHVDSVSRKIIENLINRHLKMIEHMKETSLWDVYEYENRIASGALEPMQFLAFENNQMKKEINKLRKKLGLCEKYKVTEE